MTRKLPEHIRKLIHQFNEDQLHKLHHIIGSRLQLLRKAKAFLAMRDFQVLDRIYFDYYGQRKEGTITRLNQRTISVTLVTGEQWRVAPDFLSRIDEKPVAKTNSTLPHVQNNITTKQLGRNDPCWCGSGKKWKKCHYPSIP